MLALFTEQHAPTHIAEEVLKKKQTLAGLIFHIQVYFQDFEVLSGKKGTKIGNNKNVTKKNS